MGRVKGSGKGAEKEKRKRLPEKTENDKHPLISRKWVADNNNITKQSLQSKDSHCLKKNKIEFIIVFILTESQ